ncbi:unnamed protein product [Phyllotreta striolata]|uniref:Uncharacterized protein n=1 Tax=Phyllotreta striolata TaxID=444603 RepID=A0A9N9T9X0_PHYSR|nr:unnamed protein product [Phyllotreta striolata]
MTTDFFSSSEDDLPIRLFVKPFQLIFARKGRGSLWPALKLGKSVNSEEGYRVYYFRNKNTCDAKVENVISDFSFLIDEEVSFKCDGVKKGIIRRIEEKNVVPHFFITGHKNKLYKVLYNDVYLNQRQARYLLKKYSVKNCDVDFNDF